MKIIALALLLSVSSCNNFSYRQYQIDIKASDIDSAKIFDGSNKFSICDKGRLSSLTQLLNKSEFDPAVFLSRSSLNLYSKSRNYHFGISSGKKHIMYQGRAYKIEGNLNQFFDCADH
jgi:hypothetical protein